MEDVSWRLFAVMLAGVMLVCAALVAGIVAAEYELRHQTTAETTDDVSDEIESYGLVDYEALSPEEQEMVTDVIAGERYRAAADDVVVMRWSDGRVVSHDDRYHVITKETVVDWRSLPGIASLVCLLGGLLLIAESVRRHHFPHYRPLGG